MGYVLGLVKLIPGYAHPFPQPITAGIVPDQACFLSFAPWCLPDDDNAGVMRSLKQRWDAPLCVGLVYGVSHYLAANLIKVSHLITPCAIQAALPSHAHSIRSENFVLKIAKPVQNPCSTQYVSSFSIKHITEMCPMAVRHTSDAHVIIQWWTGFRQVSDVPA